MKLKHTMIAKGRVYLRRWQMLTITGALIVSIALPIALLLPASEVFATSIGPNNPGTQADNSGVGTVAWTSVTNIATQNAVNATQSLGAATVGHYALATNYGFSIPSTAIIDGVTVTVYRSVSATSTKAQIQDNAVRLVLANAIQTTDRSTTSAWTATNTAITYGSAGDLWGATLAPSDINNTGFGIAFSAQNVKLSGTGASLTAQVDWIGVTVAYHIPTLLNQASYRVFSNTDATSQGFAAKVDYPGNGTGPVGITAADFNGDGKPDTVITDAGGKVTVFTNNTYGANNGDGTFPTKTDYLVCGSADNVTGITAADFNGDGKPDLAVTCYGTNLMSILLNNGSGSFATAVNYTAGTNPDKLTAADFNGDGKPDIAVTNYGAGTGNTVSVFMNNGTGTFAAKVDYTTATGPSDITAADFNGDGKPDLAVGGSGSTAMSILLNNGDGTFTAKVDYAGTGTNSLGIIAADFNGDGKIDLAVANGNLSVFMNNGSGTFAAKVDYTTGSSPYGVTAADFNADGKPDLAVANSSTGVNSLSVFMNNGNGTFAAKVDYTTGSSPEGIASADFNRDGKSDLIVANNASNNLSVLMNQSGSVGVGAPLALTNTAATVGGDGSAFRVRMNIGVSQADLAAGQSFKLRYAAQSGGSCSATPAANYADITNTSNVRYYNNAIATNGAGITPDVTNDPTDGSNVRAYQTYQGYNTTTFSNAASITAGQDGLWDFALTTYQTLAGTHYCLRLTSSTGTDLTTYTTYPEIITPATTYKQAAYRWFKGSNLLGNSAGFAAKADNAAGTGPNGITSGDFNGDGKPDVAATNGTSNTVSIFLNNGDGTFATKVDYTTGTNPLGVAAADFNGDGKPDLAVANINSSTVSVFINNGSGTFAAKVDYTTGTNPYYVTAADFSGDGKADIAVTNISSNTVSVFLNNGSGTFAAKVDYTTGSSPEGITSADFNGDGKTDIAVADNGSVGVSVFINNGSGTFAAKVDYTTGSSPLRVTSADYNGDGKIDLAVTNNGNGSGNTVSVFLNNGSGTFAAKVDYTTGSGPNGVTSADYNGDGKIDLAVANGGSSTVSILQNNGNGTFATKTDYSTGTSPKDITAADFNGDGKTDLAVTNNSSNTVSVLLNNTSDYLSPLTTAGTVGNVTSAGTSLRLRLDIGALSSGVAASGQSFKLQYALKSGTCAASTYADVTSSTAVQWYDNPNLTSGATIAGISSDPTDGTNTNVVQTYQESNNFTNSVSIMYAGQDGLWDFSLIVPSGTQPGLDVCFRVVTSTGTALDSYAVYPELQYGPAAKQRMRLGKYFDGSGNGQTFFLPKQ